MFYLASLAQAVKLTSDFKADGIILFQSTTIDLKTDNTSDNTSLNLMSGDNDNLLHVSIRRFQNAVVFNSMPAGGGWGAEERVALAGTFAGTSFTVTICDHGDRFQILFNGHTVKYYNKRISKNAKSVSYAMNDGQTPLFSNPIAIHTYNSMADLMAGNY